MAEIGYTEIHLPLRKLPGWGSVDAITRSAGWHVVDSNAERGDANYKKTVTWGVAAELWVMYVEDLITQVSVVIVFGADRAAVETLAHRISALLTPYSRQDVLAAADEGMSKADTARHLVRLALFAPKEFDGEIFEMLRTAAEDRDPEIRNAAAWATVYLAWPECEALLRRLAENDPDERVRAGSKVLLESLKDG
ncbi:HEAT repeat domain-containing protein [Streptomyces sp. NPDC052051]|uniref:HEAT repeat domain-containing protein n=1 Tax=Streptomyces sp. NPDC052051 TaxID=3154649 RepID=UPI0034266ED2